MIDRSPNAQPGQPGAAEPVTPLPIPDEFAARGVALAPHVDPLADAARLDAARGQGQTPNAMPDVGQADLRGGTQAEQSAELQRTTRRGP